MRAWSEPHAVKPTNKNIDSKTPETTVKKLPNTTSAVVLAALFGLSAAPVAQAATLKYAISSDVLSADPQYSNLAGDRNLAGSVFESLTQLSPDGKLIPGLAHSWKSIDPLTWEFALRPKVTFQDGSPLTPADVIYSLRRASDIVTSPASYAVFTKYIKSVEATGPGTIRVTTSRPLAILPNLLAMIYIVSEKNTKGLTSGEFGPNHGAIGTGPYRLTSFKRGEGATLEAWPGYSGKRPAYESVSVRFIPNAPSRVAALLAGDVDAITDVPMSDVARVKTTASLTLYEKPISMFLFWSMNTVSPHPPGITGKDGKPLPANPFNDVRVRQAFSKAIDRTTLTTRVLQGLGIPSQNTVPNGIFGYDANLAPENYDPAAAKALLKAAGYPDCFALTISSPNDRYVGDSQQAQAVGQMLSRLGCKVTVETMPMSVFITKANKLELGFFLLGWQINPGELGAQLTSLFDMPTNNPARTTNVQMYHTKEFWTPLETGVATIDPDKRLALYRQATQVLKEQVGVIPTHIQVGTWATKKGVTLVPRFDGQAYPADMQPAR